MAWCLENEDGETWIKNILSIRFTCHSRGGENKLCEFRRKDSLSVLPRTSLLRLLHYGDISRI